MDINSRWRNHLMIADRYDTDQLVKTKFDKLLQKHVRYLFSDINKKIAIRSLINWDVESFKNRMSHSAMINHYCFIKYENDWPYWNIKPYAYALLSDNLNLIDQFLSIEVHESKTKGNPVYFNNGIKGLLTDNSLLIEKSLDVLDYKILKRKEIRWSRIQKKCVEALANMDQQLLLEALFEFEDPRIKKQAIESDICENFISFFPIIYAKIAWMKGMEVNPESKFMPIELLKINPLEEYTIPYWFLRDFYREEGLNWRYKPIHPNLQDWDTDLENLDRGKRNLFT